MFENFNRFTKNPVSLDYMRSRFPRPFNHKTTFTSGKLIPLMVDEVLPGDTYKVDFSSVVRMLTPAVPVMDNAFLDIFFFYVPNRLCTIHPDDWQKICGENVSGYWAPATEATAANTGNVYTLSPGNNVAAGSVFNYMGIPLGNRQANCDVNLMPFVAYLKIWDQWFRDQNTQPSPSWLNANAVVGNNGYVDLRLDCMPVNKYHDLFTSVLPQPQKGNSVLLPIVGNAPVKTSTTEQMTGAQEPLHLKYASNGNTAVGTAMGASTVGNAFVSGSSPTGGNTVYPSNLYADLANATATSVNELRQAFAIQRLLEKDARGGSRFRELLKSHFGVTVPDLTVQVPEYICGKHIPLNVTQVLQNSETANTPLGTTGAFSNTGYSNHMFVKSFTEHGFLMCVGCVRTATSYSQGLPKLFMRQRRYDWYWPVFANLGEQPIYKEELYCKGVSSYKSQVFGYNEAWAEYRFKPTLITGAVAPDSGDTLMSKWTYTVPFSAAPTLNSDFMKQPTSAIGDTLVDTTMSYQFVGDFLFDMKCTRIMPLYR